MDFSQYFIEVLDDKIHLCSSGSLITTTWATKYGNVIENIAKIKESYFEYTTQHSVIKNQCAKAKIAQHL